MVTIPQCLGFQSSVESGNRNLEHHHRPFTINFPQNQLMPRRLSGCPFALVHSPPSRIALQYHCLPPRGQCQENTRILMAVNGTVNGELRMSWNAENIYL